MVLLQTRFVSSPSFWSSLHFPYSEHTQFKTISTGRDRPLLGICPRVEKHIYSGTLRVAPSKYKIRRDLAFHGPPTPRIGQGGVEMDIYHKLWNSEGAKAFKSCTFQLIIIFSNRCTKRIRRCDPTRKWQHTCAYYQVKYHPFHAYMAAK